MREQQVKSRISKPRKLYQIRREVGPGCSSKQVGQKLLERARAMRVVKFLRRRGVDAFLAPLLVIA